MEQYWPTTTDNPFDYFKQFDDWLRFDTDKGYNTCEYMSRLCDLRGWNSDLDENRKAEIINDAAKCVIRDDLLNIYVLSHA